VLEHKYQILSHKSFILIFSKHSRILHDTPIPFQELESKSSPFTETIPQYLSDVLSLATHLIQKSWLKNSFSPDCNYNEHQTSLKSRTKSQRKDSFMSFLVPSCKRQSFEANRSRIEKNLRVLFSVGENSIGEKCFPFNWWKMLSFLIGWNCFAFSICERCFPFQLVGIALFFNWWKTISFSIGGNCFPFQLAKDVLLFNWWKMLSFSSKCYLSFLIDEKCFPF
jgi:hypothetical protein